MRILFPASFYPRTLNQQDWRPSRAECITSRYSCMGGLLREMTLEEEDDGDAGDAGDAADDAC